MWVSAYDAGEFWVRATMVENIVTVDSEAPTLKEVREMIDEVMTADDEEVEAAPATAEAAGIAGGIE